MKAKARLALLQKQMNTLEEAFALWLGAQERMAKIVAWRFEPVTLKLANNTRYTPDFLVIGREGEMTFFETKGFWRDDARVKIRVAATHFPWFAFIGVTKDRRSGGWVFEEFKP